MVNNVKACIRKRQMLVREENSITNEIDAQWSLREKEKEWLDCCRKRTYERRKFLYEDGYSIDEMNDSIHTTKPERLL